MSRPPNVPGRGRRGIRTIAALLIGLLVFPAIVSASDAPILRAENLGSSTLFTQPQLLAVANLDQRIAAATDAVSRARLTHERDAALEQLTRTILSRGGKGIAPTVTATELARLRDAVSHARAGGDKTAEMTAILRLNSAILSESFTDLLTRVAGDWIRFAPTEDFIDAFNSFEHRTVFNQAPFGRTVQRLQAAEPTSLSSSERALIDAYSSELLHRYPTLRGELVNFLSSVIRFTVIVIAALYLLQHFGFDIRALLASLGIGGLAIAFAAKETIANIFGCISIIADDMCQQGDWIVTPNGEGMVIDVGLRSTKIRTFDNAVIFLPNAYLAGVDVRNWSRRKLGRRIKFTLGLE